MAGDDVVAQDIPENIAWAYHSYRGGSPEELDVERLKFGDETPGRLQARKGEFKPDNLDQVYWRDWLAHVYTMASRGEWVWLEGDREGFWDTFKPIEVSAKEYQRYIR